MATQSAHTHTVKTLYRRVIKLQLNWIIDRDLWRRAALQTRQKFEANKNLKDVGLINTRIKETQKWLKDHWHPDPYCIPTQQGGSSYQRNVAPPVEILAHDHGLSHSSGHGSHH